MEKSLEKRKLPTIAEIHSLDIEQAFKNDQFNELLNVKPKSDWVKVNKFANNSLYIPIAIIETMLLKIFKTYNIEVLREGTMFNAVYVAIRLHYTHPITGKLSYQDGLGAAQLQTKSGSSPAQLENINNNAVQMALPMAKSYAIKDAAEHLGRLFGRDLNRKDFMEFESTTSINDVNNQKEIDRIKEAITKCKTGTELEALREIADSHGLMYFFTDKINSLMMTE